MVPKPTIPKPNHIFLYFGLVLVWFLKPNQHQKHTKNQTNICVQYDHDCTEPLKPFSLIFGMFMVRFWFIFSSFLVCLWFVFGSFLMLVQLQKPNQNQTKIYEFMVCFPYLRSLVPCLLIPLSHWTQLRLRRIHWNLWPF